MNGDGVVIEFTLNGKQVRSPGSSARRVLDVLRHELGLTGTKDGCGVGECGACAILVDGEPRLSCLLPVAEVAGLTVTTIESTDDEAVERVRSAFLQEGAFQCGFCTPGMILVASRIPAGASDDEVRAAISGNLCRCSGYAGIIRAVRRAGAGDPDAPGEHGGSA